MIPHPYIVTRQVRHIRMRIDKDYLDVREQPVQARVEVPVPTHLTPDAQTWREARDTALNELVEFGVSMPSFLLALRSMLEDDPYLVHHLTGRAAVWAAALRYRGLV